MTDRAEMAARLREAYRAIGRSKRGEAPTNMQPVWDIINSMPAVIAALDGMAEFEHDLTLEHLEARCDRFAEAMQKVAQYPAMRETGDVRLIRAFAAATLAEESAVQDGQGAVA